MVAASNVGSTVMGKDNRSPVLQHCASCEVASSESLRLAPLWQQTAATASAHARAAGSKSILQCSSHLYATKRYTKPSSMRWLRQAGASHRRAWKWVLRSCPQQCKRSNNCALYAIHATFLRSGRGNGIDLRDIKRERALRYEGKMALVCSSRQMFRDASLIQSVMEHVETSQWQ